MKLLLAWSILVTGALAQFPNSQYGQPLRDLFGGQDFFSRSSNGFGSSRSIDNIGSYNDNNQGGLQAQNIIFGGGQESGFDDDEQSSSSGGKIHKFVSVHIAPPEEPSARRPSRPQIPQKAEKHYQIVFIKAPSPSGQDGQEIELPPLPETKTVVYVLLKKPGLSDMVRLKSQPTPKPTPPEVFFIRYKGQGEEGSKVNSHGGDNLEEVGYSNPGSSFESSENEEIGHSNQYGSPFRK